MFSFEKLRFTFTSLAATVGIFCVPAFAAEGGGVSSFLVNLLPLGLMFLVFYFLILRPQRRKAEAHKKLVSAVKEGDYVMLNSGIVGRVTGFKEDFAELTIYNETFILVSRQAIVATDARFGLTDSLKPFVKKTKKATTKKAKGA